MKTARIRSARDVNHSVSLVLTVLAALSSGCTDSETSDPIATGSIDQSRPTNQIRPSPRYPDGKMRFDRVAGERGYWGAASVSSLVETGVDVAFDADGLLLNIEDAPKVAPFMPWSLALYEYRQRNGLEDDPVRFCISPAGPRHLHTPPGFRIIQDRNFDRVYILFGGGNRNWRLIHMDGRTPPNPEEVVGTYFGYSTGHWEEDTLE